MLKTITRIHPASWMKIGTYSLLLVGVYYSALIIMVAQWGMKDDFSYCYLIPFVVLYLIWEKRKGLAERPSMPSWKGLISLGFGLSFFWLGELGGEYFTLNISFWLVLVGLFWIHLGWQKLKTIAFALIMILAMFPFPNFIYTKISVKLQLISSQLGVGMLHLYGMSAYREGNIIDLGFTQLQVVKACSGLRYLIPLVILGLLLAYFFRATFWKRTIVFISTVPLAILTNAMRIALTGILYKVWGAKVAEVFFHGFSAWLIFIFSLGVLLLEMRILRKVGGSLRLRSGPAGLEDRELRSLEAEGKDAEGRGQRTERGAHVAKGRGHRAEGGGLKTEGGKGLRALVSPPQFVVAVALLGATLVLSQGIEFREKIPIKKSLSQFPLELNQWKGTRQAMEQKFVDTLDLSDYVIVDYHDSTGKNVNLYVAYYESQRKGESIHSPATCLPGGGWIFKEAGEASVPIPGYNTGFIPVNRAFMIKSGYKQLSYYWFPQRGRILTNAYQLKIFAFWDALTKHRTDGALVRLITPVYESEELEDADARLQRFVSESNPILSEFLPE